MLTYYLETSQHPCHTGECRKAAELRSGILKPAEIDLSYLQDDTRTDCDTGSYGGISIRELV